MCIYSRTCALKLFSASTTQKHLEFSVMDSLT